MIEQWNYAPVQSIPVKLQGVCRITLRVRNLKDSIAFYRDFLGLEPRETNPPNPRACVCRFPSGNGHSSQIVLMEGRSPSGQLSAQHFSIEVGDVDDVFTIYNTAQQNGLQATAPRIFGGCWQTFLFDPDGYKVEVLTYDTSPPSTPERR
jgi:catechol 2,3-dioxygenase-like lactoylglutathione lyase family enzyme